ncbi:MAG: prepilin-type N-terminal cleavage/methylation domain-containing protein [Candidatus Auribacterota bacterium]
MRRTTNNGFSLLELLMAVAIMAIIVSMLYTIFQTSTRVWGKADSRVEMMQNVRVFFDRVAYDLDTSLVSEAKNINFVVNEKSIYFVCKGIYHNGSDTVEGYQEVMYELINGGTGDVDFSDDVIQCRIRHSQSGGTFAYESNFATLNGLGAKEISAYVADLTFECWNQLTGEWIDWSSWPGASGTPAWNVLNPISSNDPDDADYQPTDPSNRGIKPFKVRVTVKMVQPDSAEMINHFDSSGFNSYTSGQSGTDREKIIAELEERGLLYEYSITLSLNQSH